MDEYVLNGYKKTTNLKVLISVMVSVSVKKREYEIPQDSFFLMLLIIKYFLNFYSEYLEV